MIVQNINASKSNFKACKLEMFSMGISIDIWSAIHSCGLWDTYGAITICERDVKRSCHVGLQA
jgi:hypothetical protein